MSLRSWLQSFCIQTWEQGCYFHYITIYNILIFNSWRAPVQFYAASAPFYINLEPISEHRFIIHSAFCRGQVSSQVFSVPTFTSVASPPSLLSWTHSHQTWLILHTKDSCQAHSSSSCQIQWSGFSPHLSSPLSNMSQLNTPFLRQCLCLVSRT